MVDIADLYIAEWHEEKLKPRLCQGVGGRVLGVVLRDFAFESVKPSFTLLNSLHPKSRNLKGQHFYSCHWYMGGEPVLNVIMECSLVTKLTVQLPNNCSKIK